MTFVRGAAVTLPRTELARPPWFRRHPQLAIVLSIGLFIAVLSLRLLETSVDVPVGVLYSLPIALLAVAFGRAAGLLAGLGGVAATATWAVAAGAHHGLLAWTALSLPLVLLGVLLGDATDRLVRSEVQARRASIAAQCTREAVELNDTVVQGLAAAKWALEAGRSERGLEIVSETLDHAQSLVSQLLRDAELGLRTR